MSSRRRRELKDSLKCPVCHRTFPSSRGRPAQEDIVLRHVMECSSDGVRDTLFVPDRPSVFLASDSIQVSRSTPHQMIAVSPQDLAEPVSCDKSITTKKSLSPKSILDMPHQEKEQMFGKEKSPMLSESTEVTMKRMVGSNNSMIYEGSKLQQSKKLGYIDRIIGVSNDCYKESCRNNISKSSRTHKSSGHDDVSPHHGNKNKNVCSEKVARKEYALAPEIDVRRKLDNAFGSSGANYMVASQKNDKVAKRSSPAIKKNSGQKYDSSTQKSRVQVAEISPLVDCAREEETAGTLGSQRAAARPFCAAVSSSPSKGSNLRSYKQRQRKRLKSETCPKGRPSSFVNAGFHCSICGMKFTSDTFSSPAGDNKITQHILLCSKGSTSSSQEQTIQSVVGSQQNVAPPMTKIHHNRVTVDHDIKCKIASDGHRRFSRSSCSYECPICNKVFNKTRTSLTEINYHILKCSDDQGSNVRNSNDAISTKSLSEAAVSNSKKKFGHQSLPPDKTPKLYPGSKDIMYSASALKKKPCSSKTRGRDTSSNLDKNIFHSASKKKKAGNSFVRKFSSNNRNHTFHEDEQRRLSEDPRYLASWPARKAIESIILHE